MRRKLTLLAVIAMLFAILPISSASAGEVVEGPSIDIPLGTVVRGDVGSEHPLASVAVPDHLQGLQCDLTATAENQGSEHPGNDLRVTSGDTSILLEDVEREAGAITPGNASLVLGATIDVVLILGEDGVFSGGITVTSECMETVVDPVWSITGEGFCDPEPANQGQKWGATINLMVDIPGYGFAVGPVNGQYFEQGVNPPGTTLTYYGEEVFDGIAYAFIDFNDSEPFAIAEGVLEIDQPEDCDTPQAPTVEPMFVGPNCDDPNAHITLKTGDGEGTRHVEVLANEESIFEGTMGPNEVVEIDHEVTGPTEYLLVIDESKGGSIGNADVPTDCHVEMPSMSTDQVCSTETGLSSVSATNDGNVDGMISLSDGAVTSFNVGETVTFEDVSPGTYTLTATFEDEAETEIVEVVLVECEMDETDLPPTSAPSTSSINLTPAVLDRKSWLS